jgi:hypothetical protein
MKAVKETTREACAQLQSQILSKGYDRLSQKVTKNTNNLN